MSLKAKLKCLTNISWFFFAPDMLRQLFVLFSGGLPGAHVEYQ
jgi:hypothetical protein